MTEERINNMKLGLLLKSMRIKRSETLHQIAVATNIDSTIISKIERGDRLPTVDQLKLLANHFSIPYDDVNSKLVAERIIKNHGYSQATYKAIQIVKEELTKYIHQNEPKKK